MLNIRFIIKMLGLMFVLETFFMLSATGVAFYYGEGDFKPFLLSSVLLLSAGLMLFVLGRKADEQSAGYREGMLVVALTWASLSLFGMLPFYLGGYINNVTDAYFETMSGFTTTGASILKDIEALPHGILFWRSLTQWQGGIGVVVFTVALLPIIGGGASQMFEAEVTGAGIAHERFRPRVTQVAKRLSGIYILLTLLLTLLLWLGPMDIFDALNHALTTVSTGGYSTKNHSVGHWHSAYVEYILMVFLLTGSFNATLVYFLFKGNFKKFFHDEERRAFMFIILAFTIVTTIWLFANNLTDTSSGWLSALEETFRKAAFQVVSIISSAGFMTEDYLPWGSFFWMLALMLMFVGGCTGSTSGGFKVGRFVIIFKNLSNVFTKQMHPNAIVPVRMNGHAVSSDIVYRCLAFAFIYMGLLTAGSLVLMLNGFHFDESIAASLSAISNIGPGLGRQGPASNYADVSALSKWVLSFLMMTGRLELFTVLSLFLPGFWKS